MLQCTWLCDIFFMALFSELCRIVGPPCVYSCVQRGKVHVCVLYYMYMFISMNGSVDGHCSRIMYHMTLCFPIHDIQSLPLSSRPIYSCTMEGVVVCFTGFKDKSKLTRLCSHAHFMGASIRGDINSSVTHIVAHSVSGSKYKVAYM